MLWLLASEYKDPSAGIISGGLAKIAFRLRMTIKETDEAIKPLIDSGFIIAYQDASSSLADGYQDASPEKETETYRKEVEKDPPAPQGGAGKAPKLSVTDEQFEELWQLYPSVRDKGHKGKAREQINRKLNEGTTYETISNGITRFRAYCDATGEKQPDMLRWIRDGGFERPYTIPAPAKPAARGGSGYSLQAAHAQAMADRTRRPEGRAERLARLGFEPDTSDV
jgi:hypothetical protein